jgi:NhaP-type Na+/H+ or K+/H+ antiporter
MSIFLTNFSSILFAIFGILAGGFTEWMLSTLGFNFIPYTVFVFIEGFIIAIVQSKIDPSSTLLIEYTEIGADYIVYIFLPILLFGEVKGLNWYRVISCFKQSFILAGPGSIISCGLIAAVTKIILPNWSWSFSLLFGSVLSATDPVSVVSLLKTSGASNKLTTVIVGESLMNDGVGMIMFFYFFRILQYSEGYNFSSLLYFIFRMLILSPIYGALVGYIGVKTITILHKQYRLKNMSVYICLTIFMAYLSFYFAQSEEMLHCSGVLSCCSAGAIFAWLGAPNILVDHKMEQAWELLEWICNTLIFLLSGLISGRIMEPLLSPSSFAYLFTIYLALNLVRLIMIFVLFPLLKSFSGNGLQITSNDSFFMAWGGVRGALGISLALLVLSCIEGNDGCAYDPGKLVVFFLYYLYILIINSPLYSLDRESQGDLFFFFVGGVAGLTLLINGSLSPFVLKYLKLTAETNEKKSAAYEYMLDKVIASLSNTVTMDIVNEEIGSFNVDESEIIRLCKLTDKNDEEKIRMSAISSCIDLDIIEYLATSFLTTVKTRYKYLIKNERIGRQIYVGNLLLFTVDFAIDKISSNLGDASDVLTDWKYLHENLQSNEYIISVSEIFDNIKKKFGCDATFVENYNTYKIRKTMYALINFIDAHAFAQKKLKLFLGMYGF